MKVSKNSKYLTHKMSIELTKNPNDPTGSLSHFLTSIVAKHQKTEGGKISCLKKVSQCRKKLKGGTLWYFSTSILSKNIEYFKEGPFGEKVFFRKKVSQCRKKLKGGTL